MEANVRFYAKLSEQNFLLCDWMKRKVSGGVIFDFLMSNVGLATDEHKNKISGDIAIWYFGLTERLGCIEYNEREWRWGAGEASFKNVISVVGRMYVDGFMTSEHYHRLIFAIREGSEITSIEKISNYLMARKNGIRWIKPHDPKIIQTKYHIPQPISIPDKKYVPWFG